MKINYLLNKNMLLFICISLCDKLYSQIYPTNFIYNGCDYTYNGLSFNESDTIKCLTAYQITFEDNFDGNNLDSTNWQTYYPWGRSLHNDNTGTGFERQYYTDENVSVANGFLHIKTIIDPGYKDVYDIPSYDSSWMPAHNNVYFKYSSGMVFSKQKYEAGKFEIRARIPLIDGIWPAFWLFGSCAQEIDVFEFTNKSETSDPYFDSKNIGMSYHRQNYCNNEIGGQCDNGLKINGGQNLSDDFHIYSVEWDANKIIWRLDSVIIREVYRIWQISPPFPFGPTYGFAYPIKKCDEINTSSTYTVFNTFPTEDIDMHIILNTAVAEDRGHYPKEFIIDYVKAYVPAENGLSDPENYSFLNVFPNPTNGKFSITQSDKENPIMDIIILNALGEVVNCSKLLTGDIALIDLTTHASGIYFAKIICEKKIVLKKIINSK